MNIVQTMRVVSIAFFAGLTWCMAVLPPPAIAQRGTQGAAAEDDEGEREPKRVAIRFLTESDYPPFNYFDEDNVLTGFNIDVARAVCLELAAACDIQVRPWAELLPALQEGRGRRRHRLAHGSADALKAFDFSEPYYITPGRFAGKRGFAASR